MIRKAYAIYPFELRDRRGLRSSHEYASIIWQTDKQPTTDLPVSLRPGHRHTHYPFHSEIAPHRPRTLQSPPPSPQPTLLLPRAHPRRRILDVFFDIFESTFYLIAESVNPLLDILRKPIAGEEMHHRLHPKPIPSTPSLNSNESLWVRLQSRCTIEDW